MSHPSTTNGSFADPRPPVTPFAGVKAALPSMRMGPRPTSPAAGVETTVRERGINPTRTAATTPQAVKCPHIAIAMVSPTHEASPSGLLGVLSQPLGDPNRGHERQLPSTWPRSEEHTSELQSQFHLVCRLL